MKPVGDLQYYRSNVDGKLHPYAVCATDTTDEPKPLILEVSPGALSDLIGAVALTEEIAGICATHGHSCIVLRPTGRGPGSIYQNYGEVDVLEAIEHVTSHYAIDRDRITITGSSMGGAAVWYLISHYPDLFAGAAPFCGYCDYRLWEKPGGFTFHMNEWEEPSWQSRSAAFLVENLEYTPVWIVHGEWDRAIGGGVSIEHSRQMARLMEKKGYSYTYTEVPKTGHGCRVSAIWEKVILWLLEQKKQRNPSHVSLVSYGLRHDRSYWATIEQLKHYGPRGMLDAGFTRNNCVVVKTENIQTFSLGPIKNHTSVTIIVDDKDLGEINLCQQQTFYHNKKGAWKLKDVELFREKRHGSSGPISDLFYDELVLVPGTAGSEEETFFNSWIAKNAQQYYRSRNGGVHRGGIMGENWVDLLIVNDKDLKDDLLNNKNLLLYGTHSSNCILAQFRDELPLFFDGTTIHVSDKTYTAKRVAIFVVFPHPRNPERYAAIHGGVTPDAICWGSHLDMNLLPDYLVYSEGKLLDWGFFGNDWKFQKKAF